MKGKLLLYVATLSGFASVPGIAVAQSPAPSAPPSKSVPYNVEGGLGSVEWLDKLNGFQGKKFGTALAEFKDLKAEKKLGVISLMKSGSDAAQIGLVQLDEVIYYFHDDKLIAVSLHTKGGADTIELARLAQTAFGNGATPQQSAQPNSAGPVGPEEHHWHGKTAFARYTVHPENGEAELFIGNIDLYKKAETANQEIVVQAARAL